MGGNLGLLRNNTELNNQLHLRISRTKYKETKYICHKYKTQSWTCIPNIDGNILFFFFTFVIKIAKLHPDFLMLEIMFSSLAFEQITCSTTCHY